MLTNLSISNFALIDQLEVAFDRGLNCITGETGSGKSIIMEALEMLLGERADMKVLKNPNEKCIIEGEFSIGEYGLEPLFKEFEIDYSEQTIFRREINPQGKSRSFINDTPVNLAQMKELGALLVDIHSQHQTLDIGKSVNQFEFIDAYCGNGSAMEKYRTSFSALKKLDKEIVQLEEVEKKAKLDLDYFRFQFNELEEAKLNAGELQSLEEELSLAEHAGEIRSSLQKALQILAEEQYGIIERLRELKGISARLGSFHPSLGEIDARLESVSLELRDIESELEKTESEINFDPSRTEWVKERVNLINNLLFKHRVKTEEELMQLHSEIGTKISEIDSVDDRIAAAKSEREKLVTSLKDQAQALGKRRRSVTKSISEEVNQLLQALSMPHADFQVEIQDGELHAFGSDQLRFMIRTNKGGAYAELSKIASGGEFSRLMLALKSIHARIKTLPTIIFDEIDTGVSGEVAHKMGEIMRKMGGHLQVFTITHLPQVAVKGNAHYKVWKKVTGNNTQTVMTRLDKHSRIEEIAKMLSGDKLSDAALANAKELMEEK
ncbi:MAG: DNA repair protein RecN [Flavobacteriales bacterium]|nr:DNA repair protein RecN [Flavobacteriales bacterium]